MQLDDRFYTSTEVAEILGVSLRSVYRYLEEDKLTADVKTATGRHRFTRQNILDFLYPPGTQAAVQAQPMVSAESTGVTQPTVAVAAPIAPATAPTDALEGQAMAGMAGQEAPAAEAHSAQPTDAFVSPVGEQVPTTEQPQMEEQPGEPTGQPIEQTEEQPGESTDQPIEQTEEQPAQEVPAEPVQSAEPVEPETPAAPAPAATQDQDKEEEEVDWLAKFRAAAEKHKEGAQQQAQAVPAQPTEPAKKEESKEYLSSLTPQASESEPATPETAEKGLTYYKSNIGGLKELAQYINTTANKSNVPYAFTLNAGMSLHKLIRPFSVLHIYVNPDDKEFFEKALELTQVDEESAQLGIFAATKKIMDESIKVHGLSVVSNDQLKKDLLAAGEEDLAREMDSLS